ncbi:EXO70 [[Candida] subhashii]|uniref:Exocyst complex protein EXO70 n=1 Tax=[Candida] subhashii TaxID=561895 RepID=A0A8J5QEU4_9ASCO|nr:EXO70 [[Candida] subhashii]KAG7660607.1 EXO70 [[Candida] subhashii]
MPYKVDVDEADIAVLNQNLIKSKELFSTIGKSLTKIADKSMRASSTIKPVLADVNKLTKNKAEVEKGLSLLQEVSETAATINEYENILNNPVDVVGIAKYVNTLAQSKVLYKEIKSKFKRFKGILINFETLIDKSDLKAQGYFQKLISLDSNVLLQNKANQITELKFIFKHFQETGTDGDDYINKLYIKARGNLLLQTMKSLEPDVQPKNRNQNIPYEKGSNGIIKFNHVLMAKIDDEIKILNQTQLPLSMIEPIVYETLVDLYCGKIIGGISRYFDSPQAMIDNIILLLEIVDNLLKFQSYIETIELESKEYNASVRNFITKSSAIFREFIRFIENKFQSFEKYTDIGVPEIIVDLMSKVRKISEFQSCLSILISSYNLGDWLIISPPAKFINVYTSVIPNSGNPADQKNPEFLLSSFYSDVIDSIMINIEIGLKTYPDPPLKKSTQGFILIKNITMVESIVTRSKELFSSMGHLGVERLNKLKNRFLKHFLEDWNHASFIIISDMTTIATQNAASHHHSQGGGGSSVGTGGTVGNLSSKEREQVKELFKRFNESFEEALRNYENYSISDQNLRNYLSNEIKKLIINAYYKLYDKYANSDFTKNKSKYVKYDKNQFEKLLNEKL